MIKSMIKYIVKPEDKIVVGIINRKKVIGAVEELSERLRKPFKYIPYSLFGCFTDITEINDNTRSDIKAVAICHGDDAFSEDVGKDIVNIKLSIKYHTSMVKKYNQLHKCFEEIMAKIHELKMEHKAYIDYYNKKLKKYM